MLTIFALVLYISTTLEHQNTNTLKQRNIKLFNLYKNSDGDNFMNLVRKNNSINEQAFENKSRIIASDFAVLSLVILTVIANGSQLQQSVEHQKQSTVASYSSVI